MGDGEPRNPHFLIYEKVRRVNVQNAANEIINCLHKGFDECQTKIEDDHRIRNESMIILKDVLIERGFHPNQFEIGKIDHHFDRPGEIKVKFFPNK
jgi:hypothetical protein